PAITLAPSEDSEELMLSLRELSSFDWVIFTSVNGVAAFQKAMAAQNIPVAVLAERRIAAIGPATAKELERLGATPTIVPKEYVSEALPELLGDVHGKRVLLPRADIARKMLPIELKRRGADVTEIAMYHILPNDTPEVVAQLKAFDQNKTPDYLTFTSSSAVRGFHKLLEASGKESWFSTVPIVSIGPITAKTVEEYGVCSQIVAQSYTTDGILNAITACEEGR
ncbi:MAG: uroporphyrinogen-III synthase, partial [Bdellovibrionales bacterium]|nr:uroporphyrinogen-III synthase [Bdellovibrionales bacterium]